VTDDVNYRLFVLPATKEQLLFFSIADMHATIMAVVFACTGAPLICSSRYVRLTHWDCNLHESGQGTWQAQPIELYNFSHQWTNSSFAFKALQPESDITCTCLIPFELDDNDATVVSIQLAAHGPTTYGTTISLSLSNDDSRWGELFLYSAQGDDVPLSTFLAPSRDDVPLSKVPTTVNTVIHLRNRYDQSPYLILKVFHTLAGSTFAFGDGLLATNCLLFNDTGTSPGAG
jgi:hypothetical protein